MKLIGIVFIVCSMAYMGIHLSNGFRVRRKLLQQFMKCLPIIRNEIAFCGTPIPKIFRLLADHMDGELQDIFRQVSVCMDAAKTMTPAEAMEQTVMTRKYTCLVPRMLELADKLGNYDVEAQIVGIDQVKSQTEVQMAELDQEQAQKGKVYESLGICAGLALAILLI